jgi:predicted ATPase
MHKINRISIRGFRRIKQIDLAMRPLMVLIGANGVGKTSLLDAVALLSASAAGNLNSALSQLGGIANLLTRGKADELEFLVDIECPGYKPLEYELHLAGHGPGYSISRETLSQAREGYSRPFLHIDSSGASVKYYDPEQNHLVRPDWEHNPLVLQP